MNVQNQLGQQARQMKQVNLKRGMSNDLFTSLRMTGNQTNDNFKIRPTYFFLHLNAEMMFYV